MADSIGEIKRENSKKNSLVLLEQGQRLYLRETRLTDVNENYVRWMNNPEVNCYLECRFKRHTIESLTEYVQKTIANQDIYSFAICLQDNNKHIGNIKLGPINWQHLRADVGLLIGEIDCWGKGFASETISMVSRYAFEILDLNKLTAGCYEVNKWSARAFEKSGWLREGLRRDNAIIAGKPCDSILLGITAKDYRGINKE